MDDAKVEVFNDKQIASTSTCVEDMVIQSNSTKASKQNLTSINDAVRKRLLDSPMSEVENEDRPAKCSDNVKRKKISTDFDNSKDNSEEEKEIFYLLVSNLPFQWTKDQVSEYIQEHCVEVYTIEHFDGGDPDSGQSVRLAFLNFLKSNEARKQLKLKKPNGRKLSIEFYVPEESDSDSSSKETLLYEKWEAKTPTSPVPCQPDVDIWAPDFDGVYGLREEYLQSLGITPPLDKWVHVSNFRCDKSELKEVLELAGHVVLCNVVTISKKYARVMYSHPLEAVQAVSMLNGQLYYGQVLKVSMYRCLDDEMILPKGLANVGPGLGMLGKPLRDVVREYERYLSGKHTTVNESVFVERCFSAKPNGKKQNAASKANSRITSPKTSEDCAETAQQSKQKSHPANTCSPTSDADGGQGQNLELTWKSNVVSPRKRRQKRKQHIVSAGPESLPVRTESLCSSLPFTNVPMTNKTYQAVSGATTNCVGLQPLLPQPQPVQRFVGDGGGFPGNPLPRTAAPPCRLPATAGLAFPNPGMSVCVPSRLPGPQNPGQLVPNTAAVNMSSFNSPAQTPTVGLTATVELRNLPLSTTFPLLTEKMAQVGQVMSLELTRPGCALVRFANSAHAQSCYQQYNKMCVMGNTIEVIFI